MNQVIFPPSSSSPASKSLNKSSEASHARIREISPALVPVEGSSRDLVIPSNAVVVPEMDTPDGEVELVVVKEEEDLNDSAYFEALHPAPDLVDRRPSPFLDMPYHTHHRSSSFGQVVVLQEQEIKAEDHSLSAINLSNLQRILSSHSPELTGGLPHLPTPQIGQDDEAERERLETSLSIPLSTVLDSLPHLLPNLYPSGTSAVDPTSEQGKRELSRNIRRGLGALEQGMNGFEATRLQKRRKLAR